MEAVDEESGNWVVPWSDRGLIAHTVKLKAEHKIEMLGVDSETVADTDFEQGEDRLEPDS